MAYSFGPDNLFQAQVVILLWLVFSTTVGQVVAWSMESVRRGPFGIGISRGLLVCLGLAAGIIQLTGHATDVLDQIPTLWIFQGAVGGWGPRWWVVLVVLLVGSVTAVGAGAVPTHLAARRMPRDEARMETDQHAPASPSSDASSDCSSAATGPRSGVRCRCGAVSWCSRSAPGSWRSSATCPGPR